MPETSTRGRGAPALLAACALACGRGDAPARAADVLGPPPPVAAAARLGLLLHTDLGRVRCELFAARAPRAIALVTGLAQGRVRFRDPRMRAPRAARYYDGLTFFRRVAGGLVQTGCPLGDGTGHPGFRIPAELHDDDAALLREPGALVMARYHAPPNREDPDPPPPGEVIGSQLVIALRPMPHLAGELPVIGRCQDLDVVRALSLAREPPVLRRLEVTTR